MEKDSILSQLLELQQYFHLENTHIDTLAHKILHTFEKMDAINLTLEPIHQLSTWFYRTVLFGNVNTIYERYGLALSWLA
jgi:hypothetical protein